MSPLSIPHFSLIGVCVCILWQILSSVRKEVEERNEEKNPNIGRRCRWGLFYGKERNGMMD